MISPSKGDIKWRHKYSTLYLRLQTSNQDGNTTIGIPTARAFIWAIKRLICPIFKVTSLHLQTLAQFWSPLTIPCHIIGYRHAIIKLIPRFDFPHREHSWELLNILCAPFSRTLIHTFTLGWNFEPLTIWPDYLGYRHAIIGQIPGLDSPPREHSLEPSNIRFRTYLTSIFHIRVF